MHASVRALLHQIIDYAGLFPPAKLPLEEALHNYLRYKKESPHAWMLGRFVCPVTRLHELLSLAQAHPDGSLLSLTALGQQSSQASEFLPSVDVDMKAIRDFRQAWGQDTVIEIYEVALPKSAQIDELVPGFADFAEHLLQANMHAFVEVPLSATWRPDIDKAAAEMRRLLDSDSLDFDYPSLSLKLRCGGLTAQAFPSDEDVTYFIDCARTHGMSWKATAGLHHPCRHWDNSLQVWHHGFLNLFGADLLSMTQPLTASDIAAILADRDAKYFRFAEDRMFWKEWSCASTSITEAKTLLGITFGSCSFTEPVEDLIAMGLLDPYSNRESITS